MFVPSQACSLADDSGISSELIYAVVYPEPAVVTETALTTPDPLVITCATPPVPSPRIAILPVVCDAV